MNWSDERYVRLYTRDSATWLSWGWEARGVFCLLLRKVDRSGVIDTGKRDQVAALSRLLDVPQDVTARVLAEWMVDETVVATPTAYVIPKFLEAQEARQSDAVRQRESRERRLAAAKAQNTEAVCHTPSHAVTDSHKVSQPVTPAVPSRAVPSRTQSSEPKPEPKPRKPSPQELLFAAMQAAAVVQHPGRVAERGDVKEINIKLKPVLETLQTPDILAAYHRYLKDPHWMAEGCPWQAFAAQWGKYHNLNQSKPVVDDRPRSPILR